MSPDKKEIETTLNFRALDTRSGKNITFTKVISLDISDLRTFFIIVQDYILEAQRQGYERMELLSYSSKEKEYGTFTVKKG